MRTFPQPPVMIAGKQFPYRPRARMSGNTLEWLCPRCGKINRTVMSVGVWRGVCKRSSCHLMVVWGIRFGIPAPYFGPSPPLMPDDLYFSPEEALPECELFEWSPGEPVHSLG